VRLIFITLLALALATAVGLGSTYLTATRGTDLGTLTIGAWTARPKSGTAERKGHLVANSLQRYGFTSQEIVRGSDGAFEIRVAARSRSGNWLPTGGIERYALMLRLYDTPVGVATRTQRDAPMPSITTVGCP
jgi:hypothetical protein